MEQFDVFIIGAGACGSEIALRLAGAGAGRIGLAERDRVGGECANYACDPTKAMLHSAKLAAQARRAGRFGVRIPEVEVDFQAVRARVREVVEGGSGQGTGPFEAAGITVIPEDVRLVGPRTLETAAGGRIVAGRIVLAVGSEPVAPPIPGLDGSPFWTNREAVWSAREVPASLAVLGAGPIGIEFAQIYARFGSRVTILEAAERLLPDEDSDTAAALLPALEQDGITVRAGATASRVERLPGDSWRVELEDGTQLRAEELLVAAGREPRLDGHDLDAAGVWVRWGRPFLDENLRTTTPGIWVAGDATGELLFTHVADYEAKVVAADILGRPIARDYRVVPRVTYCDPEVASVGVTEEEAAQAGYEVVTATAELSANERARITGETRGLVKLVADARSGELLGGHVVADGAGELIGEIVTVMVGRLPATTPADAIHPYPTLSESVKAAFTQLVERLAP